MIDFKNTYDQLPSHFYTKVEAEKFSNPKLLLFNKELANDLLGNHLEECSDTSLANIFTGQESDSSFSNIACVYAGHQFGHYNPQLGDGRAMLLGEVLNKNNQRYDIQLKGSGQTPYSRRGDGKSSLGPVIREYIVSEAMHALGVPTTRALAACETGDLVSRESALKGGVLTRVASSHIRIGTIEYYFNKNDFKGLQEILDYTISRHYPELVQENNTYLLFLQEVANKQSQMIAKWMSLGFIHGVMNTDNMLLSGETIDYGPCAFMDTFSSNKVFSSIDRDGRYAYQNQIYIGRWNLYRLASCLVPLIDKNEDKSVEMINDALENTEKLYQNNYIKEMNKKFGIFDIQDGDEALINEFLSTLENESLDFTNTFRDLSENPESYKKYESFYTNWQNRLNRQTQPFDESKKLMLSTNPAFIPRNHFVEKAIQGAYQDDLSTFYDLVELLKNPFEKQSKYQEYLSPPLAHEVVKATFCGT